MCTRASVFHILNIKFLGNEDTPTLTHTRTHMRRETLRAHWSLIPLLPLLRDFTQAHVGGFRYNYYHPFHWSVNDCFELKTEDNAEKDAKVPFYGDINARQSFEGIIFPLPCRTSYNFAKLFFLPPS